MNLSRKHFLMTVLTKLINPENKKALPFLFIRKDFCNFTTVFPLQ